MSQALSRAVHVLIWENKLNHFKFLLKDLKKSFCFGYVAWIILEPRDVELESAHLLCFNFVFTQYDFAWKRDQIYNHESKAILQMESI